MVKLSEQIALEMRERIISGKLLPGSRFPNREELCAEFDVSPLVINHAVKVLAREKFVRVGARKLGTWVTPNPPHLSRYKLVFAGGPHTKSLFLNALQAESKIITASSDRMVECFFGLEGYQQKDKIEELLGDFKTRRIAGLAFGAFPGSLADVMFEPDNLPRVGIGQAYEFRKVPVVQPPFRDVFLEAARFLKEKGCSKTGFVLPAGWAENRREVRSLKEAVELHGLEFREDRIFFAPMWEKNAIAHGMKPLCHPRSPFRVDSLIIGDDNLVAGVDAGLVENSATGLPVVAHGNFPYLVRSVTPITRVAFPIPEMLVKVLDTIDQLRRKEEVPGIQNMPAKLISHEEVCALGDATDPFKVFPSKL